MVEIKGVLLSLNDIRKGIVYRYWKDPRVMYGFFTGELASPSLRTRAWSSATISRDLTLNGLEFVNSLRGVRGARRGALMVSPLYHDAKDWLFPSWPADLKAHLRSLATDEVLVAIEHSTGVIFGPYEGHTADPAGGFVGHLPNPVARTGSTFDELNKFGLGWNPNPGGDIVKSRGSESDQAAAFSSRS